MKQPTSTAHKPPQNYDQRILLAVTGLSPQIVTETLYGLIHAQTPFIPTRVHVITTQEGAERVRLELISRQPGWFHRLRADYKLPPITFSEAQIHVLTDGNGQALSDIRSPAENRAAADFISEQVRSLTADENSALHVSLAGGRKTMGFFAGYSLSLFGRPQDRLSHVLVSEHYESCADFFYPTPASQVIYTRANKPLDSKDARITLAEIPFVPLRPSLGEQLLKDKTSYNQAVTTAARIFNTPEVVIDPAEKSLTCSGDRVNLPPMQMTVYCWIAEKRQQDQFIQIREEKTNGKELLSWYARLYGEFSGGYEGMEAAIERNHGMEANQLESHFSKIKSTLGKVLGEPLAKKFAVSSSGKNNHKRHTLQGVEPQHIHIRN
ncbi:MAG: TIGR02584 family CRISPR-associated protein [gamma proteobacterium symbiont of Bathyaustriella thionipta]|nr:TIGR02584 family CRISPR-associated protein [gamma proteobacterium symbiont of Bathyaustriella thionipta]